MASTAEKFCRLHLTCSSRFYQLFTFPASFPMASTMEEFCCFAIRHKHSCTHPQSLCQSVLAHYFTIVSAHSDGWDESESQINTCAACPVNNPRVERLAVFGTMLRATVQIQ